MAKVAGVLEMSQLRRHPEYTSPKLLIDIRAKEFGNHCVEQPRT